MTDALRRLGNGAAERTGDCTFSDNAAACCRIWSRNPRQNYKHTPSARGQKLFPRQPRRSVCVTFSTFTALCPTTHGALNVFDVTAQGLRGNIQGWMGP